MEIFVIVFVVMGLLVVAMSVGVLLGRKPISGSCGGMSALGMDVACDICKGDKSKCDKENQAASFAAETSKGAQLAYDAAGSHKQEKQQ